MATLKQEILYYNDAQGKIRPNAQIFTYDSVATTTPKNTYTDESLAFPNPWPVISDGDGVFPPMWLESGGYRIVWKDENSVQFQERQDINVAETTILSTSDFYFADLVNAKLGISINGSTINLIVGQVARTAGKVTSADGLGAEWLVVAAGTGTADDNLFADLDNGLQLQRLFNQVYGRDTDYLQVTNNLSDLADAPTAVINLGAQAVRSDLANFVQAESVYVVEDISPLSLFSCDTTLTAQNVFESVGPSLSSRDQPWSTLDVLPADTKFIDVAIVCEKNNGVAAAAEVTLYSRANGSASPIGPYTRIAHMLHTAADELEISTFARIAVDAENIFELAYDLNIGGSGDVRLYLRGFGV